MSDKSSKNREALDILLGTLEENPDLWETRKKTARLLYADERYLEAADILWGAPEIPASDVDVAFALQVISRVKPNRSIRLIYEVLKRNYGKPLKNMAVARALNDVGMYMEAARFYGAAIADDPKYFNIAFERQMLWMDDSKRLIEEWKDTDQDAKMPLDVPEQDLGGGSIQPHTIPNEIDAIAEGTSVTEEKPLPAGGTVILADEAEPQPRSISPVPTQPLVSPQGMKKPPEPIAPPEILSPAGKLAAAGAKPNPLLTPAAGDAPVRPALNTSAPSSQAPPVAQGEQQAQAPANTSVPPQQAQPAQKSPSSRPLLVAGAGQQPAQGAQAAQPEGQPVTQQSTPTSANPLMSGGGAAAKPLLVPGAGASNKLLTPGSENTKTNMLIPGNAKTTPPPEGNGVNPLNALSGQGTPLSAQNASVPTGQQSQSVHRSATQVMSQEPEPLPVPQQYSQSPVLRRPQVAAQQVPVQQIGGAGMQQQAYVAVPLEQLQQMQQAGMTMGMPQSPHVAASPSQMGMPTQPMVMPMQQMPVSTQVMMAQPGVVVQQAQPQYVPASPPEAAPPAGPNLNLK